MHWWKLNCCLLNVKGEWHVWEKIGTVTNAGGANLWPQNFGKRKFVIVQISSGDDAQKHWLHCFKWSGKYCTCSTLSVCQPLLMIRHNFHNRYIWRDTLHFITRMSKSADKSYFYAYQRSAALFAIVNVTYCIEKYFLLLCFIAEH